jgi:hypothetical protein
MPYDRPTPAESQMPGVISGTWRSYAMSRWDLGLGLGIAKLLTGVCMAK